MKECILLKRFFILLTLILLCLAGFSACEDAPVLAPVPVDKAALTSLLEDFETIPQTLDQATLVAAYTAVRDNEDATQKDVNKAVAGLKELKQTIYATPMSFIDGGVEPHVRKALGYDEDTMITIGDCLGLESLDCTYDKNLAPRIQVAYDFRYFPNLTSLDLTGNNLEDLGGFAYLSKLEILSLAGNPAKASTLSDSDGEDVRSLDILGKLPIKSLDLSGDSVVPDFHALPIMPQLETLDISGNTLQSFDAIGTKFQNLTTLVATDCKVFTLNDLAFCGKLVSLDLSRTTVSDLSFLASLTSLSDLTMDEVLLADYSPLTQVPQLVSLSLSGCNISDISWIAGFTALEKLNLSKNQIADPALFSGKTAVKNLDLSGNAIAAFVLTDGWSAVEELDLSENGLASFSVEITGDCALKILDLSSNAVTLFSLGAAKKLESLNLSNNALPALTLSSDSLRSLSLSNNPLTGLILNLPALASLDLACKTEYTQTVALNLPSLKLLDLSAEFVCPVNLFSSMTSLETLSVHLSGIPADQILALRSLKELTLYGGDDASVNAVATLPGLVSLTVKNSAVTAPQITAHETLRTITFDACANLGDLSGITGLASLELVSVTGGRLSSPVLAGLPSLNSVYLVNCGLSSVSGLAGLSNLTTLKISGNGLQTVEVLGFTHLNYLDLSNNKFETMEAITIDMTKGTLNISGNPSDLYGTLPEFPAELQVVTG